MADSREQLDVTKSSGEKVPFSVHKLSSSLRRSGANAAMVQEVLRQLEPTLYEGIPTKRIYRQAFSILKSLSKPTAARYSLKQGIMQLGPSGFPFEKFVAEILKVQGYATRIGVFVDGHCNRHEIDIIAVKDGFTHMIECKFHNLSGIKSDVKIPMYIQSRFKDIEKVQLSEEEFEVRFHKSWVVTNTRFTDDAVRYGNCMKMQLMGWDYPANGSLKDFVNSFELYPLTCLTSLTHTEKQQLLEQRLVLCKELLHNKQLLLLAGIKQNRLENILKEVRNLCGHSEV
ncbi:restriction endonuclease [Pontibacter vulgaris]|uniref:restriction endonuclease n=1 Tax=Pontibacter vulgaris TaxID=2905679 RepID=UPI001FA79116|nr:restriction endonuclease [Pontibacter vulgaris]